MRLGFDLRILRYPLGGTRRYALETERAMRLGRAAGDEIVGLRGPRRIPGDAPLPALIRRPANVAFDTAWLGAGLPAALRRHRLDAWFTPAALMPMAFGRPTVATVLDLNVRLRPDDYDRGYVRYATKMIGSVARRADRIVTPSEFVRAMVLDAYGLDPERVRVVPPGLDHLARIHPSAERGFSTPYALFVGQTEPHKNLGLLLDAWRAGVPGDLHLVIAGPPGRADAALRAAAEGSDLRGRVHFVSGVDDARLVAAYRDAEMFLFPSLAEGFGFPPLEAMSLGTPTAVADASCLPETTAGGALLFDPHDAIALARLVRRLREDDALRAELRGAGPAIAARYRWAAAGDAIWDEVREVVRS